MENNVVSLNRFRKKITIQQTASELQSFSEYLKVLSILELLQETKTMIEDLNQFDLVSSMAIKASLILKEMNARIESMANNQALSEMEKVLLLNEEILLQIKKI